MVNQNYIRTFQAGFDDGSFEDPEYTKLEKVAKLLTEKTGYLFKVKDVDFDSAQNWKWTTITTNLQDGGGSFQAFTPADQEKALTLDAEDFCNDFIARKADWFKTLDNPIAKFVEKNIKPLVERYDGDVEKLHNISYEKLSDNRKSKTMYAGEKDADVYEVKYHPSCDPIVIAVNSGFNQSQNYVDLVASVFGICKVNKLVPFMANCPPNDVEIKFDFPPTLLNDANTTWLDPFVYLGYDAHCVPCSADWLYSHEASDILFPEGSANAKLVALDSGLIEDLETPNLAFSDANSNNVILLLDSKLPAYEFNYEITESNLYQGCFPDLNIIEKKLPIKANSQNELYSLLQEYVVNDVLSEQPYMDGKSHKDILDDMTKKSYQQVLKDKGVESSVCLCTEHHLFVIPAIKFEPTMPRIKIPNHSAFEDLICFGKVRNLNHDFNFAREGELVGSLGVAKEKVIFKAIENSLNELVLKLQNEDYRTKFLEKHPNLQLKDQEPIKALHR